MKHQRTISLWAATWFLASLLVCITVLSVPSAKATPYFSAQTGQPCAFCHENPSGGSTLTPQGYAFRARGYSLDPDQRPSRWREFLSLGAGFLHILFAVVWFGAIFYIHLFIKPRALVKGVPRGERLLGLASIAVLIVTGVTLAWLRVPTWASLIHTTFGIVLLVKVSLFLLMVAVAVFVNTYLHRHLKLDAAGSEAAQPSEDTGPTRIIYQGQAYDVSASKLWPNGEHMRRHQAGQDLTASLADAPHGPEVLERLPKLGPATPSRPTDELGPSARLLYVLAYLVLALMVGVLLCLAWWNWGPPLAQAAQPFRPQVAKACIECHKIVSPAIYADWSRSAHARSKVSCLHCHQAGAQDPDVNRAHYQVYKKGDNPWSKSEYMAPIAGVVSPKDCSRCHPDEAKQYSVSKHANTMQIIWTIDPWLNFGLNSDLERVNGCFHCHGTVLKVDKDGKLDPMTWPNVGVGRINLDGSKGSCAACHTRHRFAVSEARKPDTCGQCHLGPDHPQIEIWDESKHGAIYRSDGAKWNFSAAPGTWTPGVDYRTPTCAACHMSGSGAITTTHDVTERLSWELQAPLTIRPQDFKPWPGKSSWKEERAKMQAVCKQCHSELWVKSHYDQMDGVIKDYNEVYYKPTLAKLEELYAKGLMPKDALFKSPLWVEFYELWHHEGRRARMGAAMMAPDYSWWHGFYECKKRFVKFHQEADHL
ncbi:MAG: CopD family protein, partial [Desulfarculus sp.]|nr:CopD family protein [Pseudomonadota bacterium]MBV1751339.1 CopD family protein [Desulfarculus sp.]